MAQEYAKRFVTKDGKTRISIYHEDYAENPRDRTDEPLHCEDWSRDYSIMSKDEREYKKSSCSDRLRSLINLYGNTKAIIELLKANGKNVTHANYENSLMYDRSRKEWLLQSWQPTWKDYKGNVYEAHWAEEEVSFCCKIDKIELYYLTDYLSDEQIDEICELNLFTNEVKMMSYSFGYNGEISFSEEFSTTSEGICWLEKDEFLKYSGNSEEYWKSKSLTEIEFLCEELKAWSEDEVYGFVVEEKHRLKLHKEYIDEDRDDEDTEDEEWEETDSCWGFYGELDDEHIGYILDDAEFKKEELEEVA